MDYYSTRCLGRYVCVAIESFEKFLHQAKVDIENMIMGRMMIDAD